MLLISFVMNMWCLDISQNHYGTTRAAAMAVKQPRLLTLVKYVGKIKGRLEFGRPFVSFSVEIK